MGGAMKAGLGNCLRGTVVEIRKGMIETRVKVELGGGEIITAIVNDAALKELAPRVGEELELFIDHRANAGRFQGHSSLLSCRSAPEVFPDNKNITL